MSHEILVGLDVHNNFEYDKYRELMVPIMSIYDGKFAYDFEVSKTLLSESENTINRIFTITFPDSEKLDAFFSNEEYILIKSKYFNNSVKSTTIIARYDK